MGKLTSTIGIPIKLLNEAQVFTHHLVYPFLYPFFPFFLLKLNNRANGGGGKLVICLFLSYPDLFPI